MTRSTVIFISIALSLMSAANGHHGVSDEMDLTEYSLVRGITKDIEWINPHVVLYLIADPGTAFEKEWIIHMDSPSNLLKRGLSRSFFQSLNGVEFTVYHYKAFRCEEKCMGWGAEATSQAGAVHVLTENLNEAIYELPQ